MKLWPWALPAINVAAPRSFSPKPRQCHSLEVQSNSGSTAQSSQAASADAAEAADLDRSNTTAARRMQTPFGGPQRGLQNRRGQLVLHGKQIA